jgi:hypothetical protein
LTSGTPTPGISSFVLHDLSLGEDAFSDPTMNLSYDIDGASGHQHVYSTPYTQDPLIDSIPAGIYVGFEDLPFTDGSDFGYEDLQFVSPTLRRRPFPARSPGPACPG